jgi:LmbE family N-acetylglucosaminyl deacetylase
MDKPNLLAIFAHPDDEAFGTGGSLSRYAASGMQVALICATRGEVGEISDPSFATPETLGEVRESELRCAAETMGVAQLIFLDYRDSGMVGTPENKDPRAFINAPAAEVVRSLVSAIRRIRPFVVVTFEPNGGYGHPDHIAIHQHSVSAFHLAADPGYSTGDAGEQPWQASRLFYTAIPRSFFQEMRDELQAAGEDVEQFASFEERGWPDDQVTVTLDVSATVDDKWQALNCHRTQFGPKNLFRRLPEPIVKQMMSREFFALAWPDSPPGLKMADLFEGLS